MATVGALAASLTLNTAAFDAGVNRAVRQVDQLNRTVERGFGGIQRQTNDLRNALRGLAAAFVVREIVQATVAFERIGNSFRFATGSAEQAGVAFSFVRSEAQRLGLDLKTAADQFASLSAAARGTALEGSATREIFLGITEAMTVLGRSSAQTGGALQAIEQIISKGTVSAEELRGQLGERLPGAFQIAARSVGVTTQELGKLLQTGSLTAERLLPALAAELRRTFGPEVPQAAQSLQASLNRLNTAFDEFKVAVGQGGVTSAITDFSEELVAASGGTENFARTVGATLGAGLRVVGDAALFAARNIDLVAAALAAVIAFKAATFFLGMAVAIGQATSALLLFNTAIRANPIGFLASAIAAAVAALVFYRDELVTVAGITARVGDVVTAMWAAVKSAIVDVAEGVVQLATSLAAFVALDFDGAIAAWTAAAQEFGQAFDAPRVALDALRDQVAKTTFQEFANSVAFIRQVADAADEAGAATAGLSEEHTKAIAAARAEQSQLTALRDAYLGVGASVEQVQAETEIDNQLRAAKITLLEAEQSGLLELLRTNQQLEASTKALAEAQSVREQGAAIQAQIDARGRETEELRIQLAILEARSKFGAQYTAELEQEIVKTEQLRTTLTQVQAARDLGDTIQQQRLLLQFGGEETEEYRVQIRLLQLKAQGVDAVAAGLEDEVRLLESQETVLRDLAEQRQLFTDAFKNAGTEIQRTFASTFETIFSGGVKTFGDLFDEIKAIAIRTAAEMAALFIFRPQVVLSGLSGLFQAGSAASTFGGLSSVGQPGTGAQVAQAAQTTAQIAAPAVQTVAAPASAPVSVAVQDAPAFTSVFSGITGAINNFGTSLGFSSGLGNVAAGRVFSGEGGQISAAPTTGPGGLLVGGGVTSSEGVAAPGTLLGTNATLSQTLGAGAIGIVGGTVVGGLFGGQGAIGGAVGGGLGAAAGFALGGPLGALAGGGIGSLLGGALGGLFGGGNEDNQGSLRFRSTAAGPFDQGPFGGFNIRGENTFQAPLRGIVTQFDERVAEFLTARQEELAAAAVQALEQFDRREPEADPSRGFAEILRERSQAILGAAFPSLDLSAVFEGVQGVEGIADRVEQVLETIRTYGELIGSTSPAIEAAGSRLADLRDRFEDIRRGATALGLSIDELNRAEQEAVERLRADTARQVSDLIDFGFLSTGAQDVRAELEQLEEQFGVARAAAEELGLSVRGLARAQDEAIESVRRGVRTDVLNLTNFGTTSNAGAEFEEQLTALRLMFANAAAAAEELGVSVAGLAAAQTRAESQLREQALARIDELTSSVGANPAVTQFRDAMRGLNQQFADAVALARELDLPLEAIRDIIDAGRQAAGQRRAETIEELQALASAAEAGLVGSRTPAATFRAEQDAIRSQFAEAIALAKEFSKPVLTGRLQAGRDQALATNRDETLASINDLIASAGQGSGVAAQFRQEMSRLQEEFGAAREILREMNVSRASLNAAEDRAVALLRDETRAQLDALVAGASGTGAGAQFREELRRIETSFDQARLIAAELGVSITELNAAEAQAIERLRTDARSQIADVLSSADISTGAGAQFRQELQRIRDAFTDARDLARALGESVDELNAAQSRAVANLRAEAREQIAATIAIADRTTGPGQAFRDEMERIARAFADARELAIELGDSVDALNAAEQRALATTRAQAQLRIDELIATGQLTGAGARYAEELARIRAEFADGRALARALGIDVQALNDAQGRQISALKDEVRQRAALLNQDTSETVIQFREQLAELNDEFAEVIAGAAALGISIGDLSAAQERAAERLRQTTLRQAEDQALAASRQFDSILSPLREFQAELRFSVGSPVEQFRLAREEFERIAGLARSGDLSAIAAIPQAGRLFLEQATAFGASPGRVQAEEQIQAALSEVIDATVRAQQEATRGVEEEIRRASEREIDTLNELRAEVREAVRELQRVRDAVNQSRTA